MSSVFSVFLLAAAWQDFKSRKIQVWLYVCFGILGLCLNLAKVCGVLPVTESGAAWNWTAAEASASAVSAAAVTAAAMAPGILLLLISRWSRGGVGTGDGWFFIITAVYLNLWETLALLFYGLLFCSACSLGIVAWGVITGVSVRKKHLPFLPFLVPAWLWIVLA